MDGTLLEDVNTFKYLGATLTSDGALDNEQRIRLATSMLVMVRLEKIWNRQHITFHVKYNLYKSLILSILLYIHIRVRNLDHNGIREQNFKFHLKY